MKDEKFSSIGGLVNGFRNEGNPAKVEPDIIPEGLVMVSRDVDHVTAVLGFLEQRTNEIIVPGRPVPALAKLPTVDDVTDQI